MTYLDVFVGGLLPLFGHGLGLRASEQVNNVEDTEGQSKQLGDSDENSPALTLGRLSTGAVRTKSDPVG